MKHLSIILLLLAGILLHCHAQLTVADDNNVGIGVTEPVSKLSIAADGDSYSTLYVANNTASGSTRAAKFYKGTCGYSGNPWNFGINSTIVLNNGGNKLVGGYFYAYNSSPLTSKYSYGIYSIAGNAASGFNYGVWARLAGDNNGAALFATTGTDYEINTEGKYAGYFRGDVKMEDDLQVIHDLTVNNDIFYVGTITDISDINLKKDIRPLSENESSQLEKLKQLVPIKYKLKTPVELGLNQSLPELPDTSKVEPIVLTYNEDKYTKDQIGLSAQEVQLAFPELVKENHDGYLTLNYIGLIPVLIDAMKEQDASITELDMEITTQNETILALSSENGYLNEEIEKMKEQIELMKKEIGVIKEEVEKLKNPEKTN